MRFLLRLLCVLAVLAAPSLALAQVPPPVPPLPDTERRTTYSLTSQSGPFDVGFAIYGDGTDYGNWVEVFLDGTMLAPGTDWTLALATGTLANTARPLTNAQVTLTAARTGSLEIVGARRPRRTTQFNENQGVSARALNQAITDIVAQNRETWDKILRGGGSGGGGPIASPVLIGTSLYPNIQQPVTTTASSTNGGFNISVGSALGLAVGMTAYSSFTGTGCTTSAGVQESHITAIAGTSVTLSCPAIATQTGGAIQFGQQRYDTNSAVLANSGGFKAAMIGPASQGNTASWLPQVSTGQSYAGVTSLQVLSPPGGSYAGVFGGRTSDSGSNHTTYPLTCLYLADSGPAVGGECMYTQSSLMAGTANLTSHIQHEFSINSQWPAVEVDPFRMVPTNSTRSIRFDCGIGNFGTPPNDCSALMDVARNGARFKTGINVENGVMDTNAGRIAPILALPPNVGLSWYVAAGVRSANFYSAQTPGAPGLQDIVIGDTDVEFKYGGALTIQLGTQNSTLNLGAGGNYQIGSQAVLSKNVLRLYGTTSTFADVTPQAVAGSPVLLLPNTSGTLVSNAAAPLAINATTGQITCSGCGGAITLTVGAAGNAISGGVSGRVLYDNAGKLDEYTNAQLTALINPATATLSGALPAWPNNTTTYFRGDGTYQPATTTVNGVACTLGSTCTISAAASLVVGSTAISGGATARVLFHDVGNVLNEYTNTQLTSLINPATATTSGALPAFPGTTTTYFRGDGSYQTLNCGAVGGSGAFCSGTDAANLTGTVASARISGAYTGITGVGSGAISNAMLSTTAGNLGGAWVAYTPTCNGSGGTPTGSSGNGRFLQTGKTLLFNIVWNSGTALNGAVGFTCTLPLGLLANNGGGFFGVNLSTQAGWYGWVGNASGTLTVGPVSSPLAANNFIVVSGSVEVQ